MCSKGLIIKKNAVLTHLYKIKRAAKYARSKAKLFFILLIITLGAANATASMNLYKNHWGYKPNETSNSVLGGSHTPIQMGIAYPHEVGSLDSTPLVHPSPSSTIDFLSGSESKPPALAPVSKSKLPATNPEPAQTTCDTQKQNDQTILTNNIISKLESDIDINQNNISLATNELSKQSGSSEFKNRLKNYLLDTNSIISSDQSNRSLLRENIIFLQKCQLYKQLALDDTTKFLNGFTLTESFKIQPLPTPVQPSASSSSSDSIAPLSSPTTTFIQSPASGSNLPPVYPSLPVTTYQKPLPECTGSIYTRDSVNKTNTPILLSFNALNADSYTWVGGGIFDSPTSASPYWSTPDEGHYTLSVTASNSVGQCKASIPIVVACSFQAKQAAIANQNTAYQNFIGNENARYQDAVNYISGYFSSVSPNASQSAEGDKIAAQTKIHQSNLDQGKAANDSKLAAINAGCY